MDHMSHHHHSPRPLPTQQHQDDTSHQDHQEEPAEHDGKHGGHMGMAMSFYLGHQNVGLLFSGLIINSPGEMAAACVGVFLLAVLYEGLRAGRELLLGRSQGLVSLTRRTEVQYRQRMLSPAHFLQTLLHVLQGALGYFLMLVFMTYNGFLCIAVALGAGAGYFLFSWKRRRAPLLDIDQHCN